jgi:hypothetical protein
MRFSAKGYIKYAHGRHVHLRGRDDQCLTNAAEVSKQCWFEGVVNQWLAFFGAKYNVGL